MTSAVGTPALPLLSTAHTSLCPFTTAVMYPSAAASSAKVGSTAT